MVNRRKRSTGSNVHRESAMFPLMRRSWLIVFIISYAVKYSQGSERIADHSGRDVRTGLQRIPKEKQQLEHAHHLWPMLDCCYSIRPLLVEKLAEFFAIQFDQCAIIPGIDKREMQGPPSCSCSCNMGLHKAAAWHYAPSHPASAYGHLAVVKVLLAHGANMHIRGANGTLQVAT